MRLPTIVAVLLAQGATAALGEVLPASPAAAGATPPTREAIVAEKRSHEAAIADCERMWDPDTHMTKVEWRDTCRRVQDRLRRMQLR